MGIRGAITSRKGISFIRHRLKSAITFPASVTSGMGVAMLSSVPTKPLANRVAFVVHAVIMVAIGVSYYNRSSAFIGLD